MAKATITIEDNEAQDGTVQIGGDFGELIDENSPAHQFGIQLLKIALQNAKNYDTVEDTAPATHVEPSRIILPPHHQLNERET